MNISVEMIYLPEQPCRTNQELCRRIRTAVYPGAQKQSFYIIAPVKLYRNVCDFLRSKDSPLRLAAAAVNTIGTVIDAIIRHEDFQQGYTPAVTGPGMTDAGTGGITDTTFLISSAAAAGRAGNVIFCCITQNV